MTVNEVARLLGGTLRGDGSREIRGVAGLESAGPDDLTYADSARALDQATRAHAGVILVREGTALEGQATLAVAHPKLAFIRAAQALCPPVAHPPEIQFRIAPGGAVSDVKLTKSSGNPLVDDACVSAARRIMTELLAQRAGVPRGHA